MSGVIDLMVDAANLEVTGEVVGFKNWPVGHPAMKAALRAAEQAGWRLVPVEPTYGMCEEAVSITVDSCSVSDSLRKVIQVAPRPWDEVEI